MTPLEAAALVALLVLPFHGLVLWHLDRLQDPKYLRAHGIVVVRESAFQGHTKQIGSYSGHAIWEFVTFMGMTYRFDRVARPQDKEKTGPGEIYVDPGLVYVAA